MATYKAEPGFTYYLNGDASPKEYKGQFPISALADLQRGGKLHSVFVRVGDGWVQLQTDGTWVPNSMR